MEKQAPASPAADSTTGSDHAGTGRAFTASLDREGYSFHHAVLRCCDRISRENRGYRLSFEVSEFPVQTRGKDGRVDFILRVTSEWSNPPPVFLVCECKRSNPALSDWCFARAPYVRRGWQDPEVTAESLSLDTSRGSAAALTVSYHPERRPYHIGLPVKTGQAGDPKGGNTREVIEDAASQVVKGLNGFADFLNSNWQILAGAQRVVLLPVVFTTATLFASDVDLGNATITDGTLPHDAVVESVPWLWFQYHVSSSLRHNIRRAHDASSMVSLGDVLHLEHSRSIAIVSVGGIEAFVRAAASSAELFRQVNT
jgi:hypothetical protein